MRLYKSSFFFFNYYYYFLPWRGDTSKANDFGDSINITISATGLQRGGGGVLCKLPCTSKQCLLKINGITCFRLFCQAYHLFSAVIDCFRYISPKGTSVLNSSIIKTFNVVFFFNHKTEAASAESHTRLGLKCDALLHSSNGATSFIMLDLMRTQFNE
ncbi:hypothetical protein Tb927.2.2070 [Trypanosoma brucei brucei TREU927]|uniref:Uncharacterized protein n=1 Tax=Trypanosoma brucei brucei (strain 927/4 GUTat10.1) TaxID=185431 RepID=Q586J2_TRYB2|nr:hypothetical protein Tb927.2.2070 [Trypanosoma brucei brucei TREU927]AAQ15664.1 hypothetical protein Tb927.2.2070 [Trypanosoma brucei brucei TREU927]AAX79178.1 hypothetical protein Tb927.2.2070 [Trypanosoma brucei]